MKHALRKLTSMQNLTLLMAFSTVKIATKSVLASTALAISVVVLQGVAA